MNFLKGYKTYIVGVLLIVSGVFNDLDREMILEGLGLITLRLGIADK